MGKRRSITAMLCLLALSLGATPSQAAEPANDSAPWMWFGGMGDVAVFNATYAGNPAWTTWGDAQGGFITSSTDVDYVYVACGGRPVQYVNVLFTHAKGDIDIAVYDLKGTFLGSSMGVTNEELIQVSQFGKEGVYVKVYGYNGAQNSFGVQARC